MEKIKVLRASEAAGGEFDWGSLTWFASAELGNSDCLTVGRCVLEPGMSNPRHHHPDCEEVLHVLAGRIAHALPGGREVEMSAGDTITLPAGAAYFARNIGDEDAVLFVCLSSAERKVVGE